MQKIKPLAMHLPQFHRFPENDKWWGKGFTEWTNVTKAKPQFEGHYQPHLPAELGYYDLRIKQSLIDQVILAKEYGIHGFCYYHYWFNGKRLMHEPLDIIIGKEGIGFPFMFCWANENWSRRWDGDDTEILIKQEYSAEDDIEHINFLINKVFSHPDYIKVENKPFFIVYRPSLFPDITETLKRWRCEASKKGLELYIGYMQGFQLKENPLTLGFDVAIDFQPDFYFSINNQPSIWSKIFNKLNYKEHNRHKLVSYESYVENMINLPFPDYPYFPTITPMWDNTPRRKQGAFIFTDSTPVLYQKWLEYILRKLRLQNSDANFLFINAWNEWAEGNHLEPCQKWGKAYLEATKNAIESFK